MAESSDRERTPGEVSCAAAARCTLVICIARIGALRPSRGGDPLEES